MTARAPLQPEDRARLLVDENNHVTEPLMALLTLSGLDASSNKLPDVVEITQKAWLRPTGLERMHMRARDGKDASTIEQYFAKLGLVQNIQPTKKHYDYVLLLGATYHSVARRLQFLDELSRAGLTFQNLALLGSYRLLDRQHEIEPMTKSHVFDKVPLVEIEMIEALFAMSSPTALNKTKIIRVASPMKKDKDGRIVRANTLDTIEDFLKTKPKPGSVLAISSQPSILRQHLVVKKALGPEWDIETVGSAIGDDHSAAVILDELARTLYELESVHAS